MSVHNDKSDFDRTRAEHLIAAVPLIPEVQSIDVELYTDHTGDPSFELVFHLRRDVEVNEEFFRRFFPFKAAVQTKILHSDLDRFPYTRTEQAA